MKREYIFTWGTGQAFPNGYYVIKAETRELARAQMFELFGQKWSMQYDSRETAGVYRFNLKELGNKTV